MIRRPPRSTLDRSSAASDVYKRQVPWHIHCQPVVWTKVEPKIVDVASGEYRVGGADETFVGEHAQPLFQIETLACGGGECRAVEREHSVKGNHERIVILVSMRCLERVP